MKIEQNEVSGDWTEEDETELRRLVAKRKGVRRGTRGYDLKFVEDLLIGEEAETALTKAFSTAEVKRIRQISKKGRGYKKVFVEFENRKKLSGLSTTEAGTWIFVLGGSEYDDEVFIGIAPHRLQAICEKYEFEMAGDSKASKGKRVKVHDLLLMNKEIETIREKRLRMVKSQKGAKEGE